MFTSHIERPRHRINPVFDQSPNRHEDGRCVQEELNPRVSTAMVQVAQGKELSPPKKGEEILRNPDSSTFPSAKRH